MSDKKPEFNMEEVWEKWLPYKQPGFGNGNNDRSHLESEIHFLSHLRHYDTLAVLEAIMNCLNNEAASVDLEGQFSDSVAVPRIILEDIARLLAEWMPLQIDVIAGSRSQPRTSEYRDFQTKVQRWNAVNYFMTAKNEEGDTIEFTPTKAGDLAAEYNKDEYEVSGRMYFNNWKEIEDLLADGKFRKIYQMNPYSNIEPQPNQKPI